MWYVKKDNHKQRFAWPSSDLHMSMEFRQQDFLSSQVLQFKHPLIIFTNLPYGHRITVPRNWFDKVAKHFSMLFEGGLKCAYLVMKKNHSIPLPTEKLLEFQNRGISVKLVKAYNPIT